MENKIPHILIVDDDVNLLGTMSDILKMKGFEPVIASTGAAALAEVEKYRFDLALIDLRLDDMSGLIVLKAIKTRSPETECILLTGHASQNSAIEAIRMGVYGFFQKPFDMEQVLLSIQRAIEKQQSAQALHNSEKRFRALIENGRDNISLLAADGTLLWESPSTKSTLGYAPDQFVGHNIFELLHPDDWGLIQELFAQLVQSPGKSEDGIFRLQHGDGTWRWIEATAANMLNEPSVQAIVINYRDITERKQAEDTLLQRENLLNKIFDVLPVGIWLADKNGQLTRSNQRGREIWGAEPLVGQEQYGVFKARSLPSGEELAPEDWALAHTIKEGVTVLDEMLEIDSFDGKKKVILNFTAPVFDATGNVEAAVIINLDITERKQAENALRESEERFRVIFEKANDAIHIDNANDKILAVNSRMCELMGYSREELLKMHVTDLQAPEIRQSRNVIKTELEQHGNAVFEGLNLHRDGRRIPVEISIGTIEMPGGELYISVVRDITERKHAEAERQKSNALYHAIFNTSPDNITITDMEGRILMVSRSAVTMFGCAREEEMLGRLSTDFIFPEDWDRASPNIGLMYPGSMTGPGEYCGLRKDGSTFNIEGNGEFILDADGHPASLVIIMRDITARKQAEKALRRAEENYRNIFENALEGIYQSLPDGRFITVNPAFARMLGYESPGELIETVTDIASQTYAKQAQRAEFIQAMAEHGSVTGFEFQMKRKDGGIIWVSENVRAVCDDTGKILYYEGSAENITDRKQAEEALLESEKRYRTIFDGVQDAIFVETKDGRILEVNNSACEMYGYKRDEFLTKTVSDFVLEGSPVFTPHLNQPKSPSAVFETVNRRANGEVFPIEINGGVQVINGEEVLLVIVRDITERKQAELALGESQRRLITLMANLPGMAFRCKNNHEWTMEFVSEGSYPLTGYHPAELINSASLTYGQIIHSEDRQMTWDVIQAKLEKKQPYQLNYRIITASGKERWVWEQGQGVYGPAGDLLALEGFIEDITERRQAEETLRESKALYRQAIEVAGAVPYLQSYTGDDSELHYDFIGEGIVQITGYEDGEFNAALWDSLVEESVLLGDLAGYSMGEAIRRVRSGETPLWKCEHRIRARDGKVHWVFEAAVELYAENGVAKGSIGMFQDITERKQTDMALAQERNLLRTLIDILPDRIYVKDTESRFLLKNLADALSIGVDSPNEMVGKSDADYYPLEMAARFYADDQSVIQSGQPLINHEESVIIADGTLRWLLTTKVPWRDSEGCIIGLVGIGHDITERKQAEDLLRKSEKRYHDLFEDSPIALREEDFSAVKQKLDTLRQEGVTDFHTYLAIHPEVVVECAKMVKIKDVNKSAMKMYRADNKNNMPNSLTEILGKAHEHFRDQLANIAEGQIEFTWEGIDHTIDGRQIDVEVNWSIAAGYENDLSKVIVSLQDIGARRQAEEITRQRVKELELLYQSGLVFSQLLNPKEIAQKIINLLGEKLDWHHTAIRLLRTQDELELVAFDQPGLEHKAAVEAHLNNLITHVGQGVSGWALQQSKTIRLGDVNSDPHYVASYPDIQSGLYVPLKSGDRMVGVISIESEQPDAFSEADEQLLATLASQAANAFENARLYQEINRYAEELEQRVQERTADLSLANSNLARALRVKDEFLASMSHELRTPLTGILGLSEALRLNVYGELNEKQGKTLKNIEESGRHLLDLINDILDLSKIEAGKLELQFAPCSLTDICQASLQLIKGMAQKKNQQVRYIPPAEPIIIRADARRLKQLLVNLLSNAIKFTPQNGELGLEVQINKDEQKFKLIVWDKGIGINSEELQNIFKPFVQLDSGLAREYSGTGLGLSLVQHLTELHNGGIEVESRIGEGSRFTIALPWSSEDTVRIPYMPKGVTGRLVLSPDQSKSPLVMFADDNEMVLQMVADFLEANQYRVMKVRNGTELLGQASEFHPDIMLVDIQMPGIGGLETIRRIRSHPDPRIAGAPVIAVTALAMPADRERCLRAGANEYMSKPLKLKTLVVAIQKLLERKP